MDSRTHTGSSSCQRSKGCNQRGRRSEAEKASEQHDREYVQRIYFCELHEKIVHYVIEL